MYLSHVLFVRPAGGSNLKWNEAHSRQTAETQESNKSPHPPRKNYKDTNFVTSSGARLYTVNPNVQSN